MTVEQLRRMLLSYDDDDVVVLSRDSEGNGYSTLSGAGDGFWSKQDECFYSARDIVDCHMDASKMYTAICLWPE